MDTFEEYEQWILKEDHETHHDDARRVLDAWRKERERYTELLTKSLNVIETVMLTNGILVTTRDELAKQNGEMRENFNTLHKLYRTQDMAGFEDTLERTKKWTQDVKQSI